MALVNTSSESNIPQPSRLGRAALAYAERFGWAVLPLHSTKDGRCTCGNPGCASPGKHPITPHGVKDANKDPTVITRWWRRWPWANVGVATGAASGVFVLDVDGTAGRESLAELEEKHGKLPDTIEQITGSGGRHILFKYPGQPIANKVCLAPGLDVRGDGGYIVAPPSLHVSGRRYEWEVSSRPGAVPLAEAPGWLLELLQPVGGQGMSRTTEGWRHLVAEGVEEGKRNTTIASLAGHLLRHYIDPYVTLDLLLAWNRQRCRPPLPDEEVVTTINSVAKLEAMRRGVVRRG